MARGDSVVRGGTARSRKREHERFTSDLFTCALGDVADVSGGGLRVRVQGWRLWPVGRALPLSLRTPLGRLTLRARVAWCRRTGLRQFEAGLAFIDIKPGTSAAIHRLAEFGFIPHQGQPIPDQAPPKDDAQQAAPPPLLAEAFQTLGVSPLASPDEVHRAYRTLARQYHPDMNGSHDAAERFKAVAAAYRTLRSA